MFHRESFYNAVRMQLFGGSLRQDQVNGIDAVLREAERRNLDQRMTAYILATVWHETGKEFQPIDERGGQSYFRRMYEGRKDLGNTERGDGALFHGRGLVQITGRRNYELYTELLRNHFNNQAINLVREPVLAKKMEYAIFILFDGMLNGRFTGKKLGTYINASKTDYYNARRVVNGIDKAQHIADAAKKFHAALKDDRQWIPTPRTKPPVVDKTDTAVAAGGATVAVAVASYDWIVAVVLLCIVLLIIGIRVWQRRK